MKIIAKINFNFNFIYKGMLLTPVTYQGIFFLKKNIYQV